MLSSTFALFAHFHLTNYKKLQELRTQVALSCFSSPACYWLCRNSNSTGPFPFWQVIVVSILQISGTTVRRPTFVQQMFLDLRASAMAASS